MGKIERMVFMEVKALFPALTLCVRVYDYLSTKCKAFQSKKIKFFISNKNKILPPKIILSLSKEDHRGPEYLKKQVFRAFSYVP